MSESRVKRFLKNGLPILILFIIAAVSTLLNSFGTDFKTILIVDILIASGIGLAYFDERIAKLERDNESFKHKFSRLNKKGVTPIIGVIILLFILLLVLAILTGTPNLATQLLGVNITATP